MLGSKNGDPRLCAENLLKIRRGEVAYDRIRGIDTAIIDTSPEGGVLSLRQDVDFMLPLYEPRVEVSDVELNQDAIESGEFAVTAVIKPKEIDNE